MGRDKATFSLIRLLGLAIITLWSRCQHANCLVQKTNSHKLYYVFPSEHEQLVFLNEKRLEEPGLIFWNGIGIVEEKVYILATDDNMRQHRSSLEMQNLTVKVAYSTVKITYIESNPEHPNKVPTSSLMEKEAADDENSAEEGQLSLNDADEIDDNLNKADALDDQTEAEMRIMKRTNKYHASGDVTETIAKTPRSHGLVPVNSVLGYKYRKTVVNTGLLYRIQCVQSLILGNFTSLGNGDWTAPGKDGHISGVIPRAGEYLGVSMDKKRDGSNPFITSEEDKWNWKNYEYQGHKTKSVLWMFIPSEIERFYEIRNREYPMSLLIWTYDKEEGEFLLVLETRRKFLKRYQPEGDLRNRALFSLEMIPEVYGWELRQGRAKFYITTVNSNHVFLYESFRKECTIMIVRNSALEPYTPEKTDKVGRPLDMFYITRLNLTGQLTASVFSFMYEKSIVDIFAHSANKGMVMTLGEFDLMNRASINTTHYVYEEITRENNFTFHFHDKFTNFGWVTVESQIPSFGISPTIRTGLMGPNTDARDLFRRQVETYRVHEKIKLETGDSINGTSVFQFVENFDNPFTALMEVTEPADRLFWDKNGKPRFIRLSLPGNFIEHGWDEKAKFHYERIIEKREAALVVQVKGNLYANYGLRGFIKKTMLPFTAPMTSCDAE